MVQFSLGEFGFGLGNQLAPIAPDTTGPVLSLPTAVATSDTTATGTVTSDEAGIVYAVETFSVTKPSAGNIKNGLDHLGLPAPNVPPSQSLFAPGVATFPISGLNASTGYYTHYVEYDYAGNPSNVVTAALFTTNASPFVLTYGWDPTIDEGQGAAGDLYVDSTRPDDTGAGTSLATAKKTIGAALAIGASKIIRVKGNNVIYPEGVNFTGKGGTAGNPTTIVGLGTDKPNISGRATLTGFVPCVSGDAAVVGANWANIYKLIGFTKSNVSESEPRNLNLYEAGLALYEAIDRPSDGGKPFFIRNPATYYVADQIYKAGDVAATSGATMTGIKDVSVTSNYSDPQIVNADILVYMTANQVGRAKINDITSLIMHMTQIDTGSFTYYTAGSVNTWCLINILPAMIQGSYGFVDNGTTIDIYLWPRDPAHLASGIEYSARAFCLNLANENHIAIRSVRLTRAATGFGTLGAAIKSTGGVKSDVSVTNTYQAENACSYYDGRGYGSMHLTGYSDVQVWNNTIEKNRGMFGAFVQGGSLHGPWPYNPDFAQNVDFRYNLIIESEQSGLRAFTLLNAVVAFNKFQGCGGAAHANKMNFYEQCQDILVWGNNFEASGGYVTWQECDNIFGAFNYIPDSGEDNPRNIVDQNHDAVDDGTPGLYRGGQVNCLWFNNTCLPHPTIVYSYNVAFGQAADTNVFYEYYNNIFTNDNVVLAQIAARDYNIYTTGTAVGAHSITSSNAAVYNNPTAGDFTFKAGGPAYTAVGKNMQALIDASLEPRFGASSARPIPFTDWNRDMNGQLVDWTDAPIAHINLRPLANVLAPIGVTWITPSTDTTPDFQLTLPSDKTAGDIVKFEYRVTGIGSYATYLTHTVTSGDIAAGTITLTGVIALTDLTQYDFRAHIERGTQASVWVPVAVTINFAPAISTLLPLDNELNASTSANLVLTFDRSVAFGTGSVKLYDASDTLVEDFAIATDIGSGPGKMQISGAVLTIDPTAALSGGQGYYVQIDSTAIKNLNNINFAGIANKTTWNFTTAIGGGGTTAAAGSEYMARSTFLNSSKTDTQYMGYEDWINDQAAMVLYQFMGYGAFLNSTGTHTQYNGYDEYVNEE